MAGSAENQVCAVEITSSLEVNEDASPSPKGRLKKLPGKKGGGSYTAYIVHCTAPDGASWDVQKRYRSVRSGYKEASFTE